jgi:methylglyoxal synthase
MSRGVLDQHALVARGDLAEALQENTTMTALRLSCCNIGDDDISSVSYVIGRSATIQSYSFVTKMLPAFACALAGEHSTTIEWLSL